MNYQDFKINIIHSDVSGRVDFNSMLTIFMYGDIKHYFSLGHTKRTICSALK